MDAQDYYQTYLSASTQPLGVSRSYPNNGQWNEHTGVPQSVQPQPQPPYNYPVNSSFEHHVSPVYLDQSTPTPHGYAHHSWEHGHTRRTSVEYPYPGSSSRRSDRRPSKWTVSGYSTLTNALVPAGRRRNMVSNEQGSSYSTLADALSPLPFADQDSAVVYPKRYRGPGKSKPNDQVLADKIAVPVKATNHLRLPQIAYSEMLEITRTRHSYFHDAARHPTCFFQMLGFPEAGVSVGSKAALVAGDERLMLLTSGKEIKIHLVWPGYPCDTFERRVKTRDGSLTRDELFSQMSSIIVDFMSSIRKMKIRIQHGYEDWAIGGTHKDGTEGLTPERLLISAVVHRGSASWQPEILVPTKKVQARRGL